jgi:hypothetical protein
MSSGTPPDEKPITTMGIWLFGGLSVLLVLGKVLGLWSGSWWRMAVPGLIFVLFNALYIAMGFLYLTVSPVRERPEEEERALLGWSSDSAFYGSAFLFVAGFVINVVSRLESATASTRWWVLSGRAEVLMMFGGFAVVSLWLYWSQIGRLLGHADDYDR